LERGNGNKSREEKAWDKSLKVGGKVLDPIVY